MRVSQQEKDRSHRRIVDGAARLIRERGVDGAGVAEVMKDAGMTPGGFYRHFASKEDLIAAAVNAAFHQNLERFGNDDDQASKAVAEFERFYLSETHVNHCGYGCPIPALAGEVGRNPALTAPMTTGIEHTIDRLAAGQSGSLSERRAKAAARLATMAGAVAIARASDPRTAQLVLESARERLGINEPTSPRKKSTDQGDAS